MSANIANASECPNCRAPLAAGAARCVCGHTLDASTQEDSHSSNLVVQAEALYETHLRARLQRALRTLKLAKVDLLRDPRNPGRRAQLREAEKEVRQLQTQVEVQASRVVDATVAAMRAQAQTEASASAVPDAFRAAQAARAEHSLEFVRTQIATEVPRSSAATSQFSAKQAEKANAVEPTARPPCPACGTIMALGVSRCQCGHQFLTEQEGAADFISSEELAALRGV